MFSQQFEKDLATWKRTRLEYGKLLKALKGGSPDEELAALGDDAGIFSQEIIDLRRLRERATAGTTRERAGKHDKLEKELATLIARVREVDKSLALASTKLAQDKCECELYDLGESRQKLQMALADSSVAHNCVEAARAAGVV